MSGEPLDRRAARAPAPAPSWLARVGDLAASATAALGFQRWARVGAVTLVPLLLPGGRFGELGVPFVVLAVYAVATVVAGRDLLPRYGDLLAATGLVLYLGPSLSPFLPFLLVAVAGRGVRAGIRGGILAGCWLSALLLVHLAVTGELGTMAISEVLPVVVLLPLAGTTAAAAAQLLQDHSVRERLVLQQANRLLSALRTLADDLPSRFDASTVGAALVATCRDVPGLHAVSVYAEVDGVLQPVATAGLSVSSLPRLRVDEARDITARTGRLLTPAALPPQLATPLRACRHWLAFPLGDPSSPSGLLLAGAPDADLARAARQRLASIAADAGLALENARLFDGTRARTADAVRRKVAADLHDGVAQALAHLRMELELLAREPGATAELARLSQVADSALRDLRVTIGDLRTNGEASLAARLARHLDELRSANGPQLELLTDDPPDPPVARADDLLRIAQEAVSNALRHSRSEQVTVLLARNDGRGLLEVADDGVGAHAPSPQRGGGVGLGSMRERAERLGGSLRIDDGPDGGTVVSVRFPAEQPPTGARRSR